MAQQVRCCPGGRPPVSEKLQESDFFLANCQCRARTKALTVIYTTVVKQFFFAPLLRAS